MRTVYEGTWEEVLAHAPEFEGQRVKLIVQDSAVEEQLARLERGLAMAREASKGLGPFPRREITLDVFYPDEDEPRR